MNTIGNQNIYLKLNILEKRIDNLETKLDKILELLEDNSKDCKKMSSHIDFIDNIYENIKLPMNFICESINNRLINN